MPSERSPLQTANATAPTTTGQTLQDPAPSDALRSPVDHQPPPPRQGTTTQDPDRGHRLPRAPNPAKRVVKNELHSAITRAEEHQSQQQTTAPAPHLAAAPHHSPPTSPTTMSSSIAAMRPDRGAIMAHRTASIDSTVSAASATTTASQRANNGTNAYRVSQDAAGPQDIASVIAAAGSAEAALQKVLAERQQAASHNAQLWRLVEKQRSMILGLNRDLEKSLKEKERYRRKLKDHLAQSASAPALITANIGEPDSQEASPSPSLAESRGNALVRDISVDTRKTSETSGSGPHDNGRSDTPQDAATTPQSADSLKGGARELERVTASAVSATMEGRAALASLQRAHPTSNTPPMSPKMAGLAQSPKTNGHQKNLSTSSFQTSPPPSATSFSSPKTRKAPPAPLNLQQQQPQQFPDPHVMNNIIDASDSEYEEDPESARSEHMERGRRKTREEDDREREAMVHQEEEQRSRSKKDKKSKSRPSLEASEPGDLPATTKNEPGHREPTRKPPRQPAVFQPTANPAEILRNRAVSDAANALQRNNTAPSLLSPGLPMSPRPGDRPPNSPMPRAPNVMPNSIPLSPRAGVAGLPLSPRAPRQPIPMPPQTPLSVISPHLDRAKGYHLQAQAQSQPISTVANRLRLSPDGSPEYERPSNSSDPVAYTPGEIYRGFVTEEYPDLLLPPNALPSIYVKTASSRMRPSRASFIAPKHQDENPVFTLAVHERSGHKQLWRVEKTYLALATLDHNVKALCKVNDRLPDKALFTGHAPAKIDARRQALNHYFERMLDSITQESAAKIVCRFLSVDAIGGEQGGDYFGGASTEGRPDSPVAKLRPNRAGYLTKRGKNFGGWKARYFVLDGPNLKYFEGPGGAHLGSIKLQNAQIGKQSTNNASSQEDEENQFRHAFLILEPKKKDSSALVRHVLCAESDDERDAWVDALLQYVDYRDDEELQLARQAQVSKTEISVPRSPRLQKSMSDLRPASNNSREMAQSKSIDQVRTVNYSETIAGDAPVMGVPQSPRTGQTPSPPYDKLTADSCSTHNVHPMISGPTNLQVIQNAGDWGMRPPPTPGAKDKKRSVFSNLPFGRGRSSSDLAPGDIKSPGLASPDRPSGMRAVFGVPLAEAVAFAHPANVTTDLPAVVYRCIEYLTAKNAIAEEGLFRLSGSSLVIKALKDRFNAEGDVDLLAEGSNGPDVNAVASLLKTYLRELPASILTRDLHMDFLACLEMHSRDQVPALNVMVNKLPRSNRALLEAMSEFMLLVVNNAGQNKMNVRNLGLVFSPTLNIPNPLIALFVEEQHKIFGPPMERAESPASAHSVPTSTAPSTDLRSPRKQMFSDLPTPAYNQTQFQPNYHDDDNTGMIPMHPQYASYQMAPQGEGGFGSLNDALRSPTVYSTTATGAPTPRDIKQRRRESGMLLVNNVMGPQKKKSHSRLREEQGTSF